MDVNDVRGLPWIKVDENEIFKEAIHGIGGVSEEELKSFAISKFREIGRRFNMIPYEELEAMLKDENEGFFLLIEETFLDGARAICSRPLKAILEKLTLPDLNAVPQDGIEACIKAYEKLTPGEKVVFFERIGKINYD